MSIPALTKAGGKAPPASEDGEEARAFLQQRTALFWKVICFIMLFASALGLGGALKRPGGTDLVLDRKSAKGDGRGLPRPARHDAASLGA